MGAVVQVRDYVRRRRWHRTRVFAGIPLQDSPPPRLPLSRMATPSPAPTTSMLSQSLTAASADSAPSKHASPPPPLP